MSSFHLILCKLQAGSAMRVSGTIVRMTALPAETQQKIIVKLHSFNVFQQDYVPHHKSVNILPLCREMQHIRRDHEVDRQRDHVHDRRDQRAGHDRRVKTEFVRQKRQCTSDRLRDKDNKYQCAANDQGDLEPDSVKQHELGEIAY